MYLHSRTLGCEVGKKWNKTLSNFRKLSPRWMYPQRSPERPDLCACSWVQLDASKPWELLRSFIHRLKLISILQTASYPINNIPQKWEMLEVEHSLRVGLGGTHFCKIVTYSWRPMLAVQSIKINSAVIQEEVSVWIVTVSTVWGWEKWSRRLVHWEVLGLWFAAWLLKKRSFNIFLSIL